MKMFSRVVVCAAGLTLLAAAPAAAAKRVVDSDGQGSATSCTATTAAYFTIASAVAAAAPGDQIIICPGAGPYNEQVSVDKALTLTGKLGATVRPSPMVANSTSLVGGAPIAAAIVIEDGVSGAHIDQLTVDGSGNGIAACAPSLIGVYYRNASGSVKNSVVKNFRHPAGYEGCQSGLGIYAQSDGGSGISNVTVSNTSVHDFQKNGITGNESGTTLTATGNFVTGDGPSPIIAQNGIQVGWGAKGLITNNVVSDLVYSPATYASAGILVFDAPAASTVNSNTVTTTQVAVYLDTDNATANTNVITNTVDYDGIYLSASASGNTVSGNTITNSDESGIWIDGSGNTVTKNKINEAPLGIVDCGVNTVPTSGSLKNVFYNVPVPAAGCPAAPLAAAAAERPAARVSTIR